MALISDHLESSDVGVRSGAILGLGLAYAGTRRNEVQELLVPLVSARVANEAAMMHMGCSCV
jgi:26S proteasome regulatory subunit N1